uniref:AT-hook motif nuclear-localized protein n=1 Tax=Cajanus cajan TaxID=3821 RepID=A0A151U3B1_CAJCA|nr:hypothetical protein KK1_006441 [Cajanus cajan]
MEPTLGSTVSAPSLTPSVPQTLNMNVNMNVGSTETTTTVVPPAPAPVPVPATTTTTAAAVTPTTLAQGSLDLFGKKKRGRPRKYDADGNLRVSATPQPPPPPGFTLSTPPEFSSKRGRGKHAAFGTYQPFSSFGEVFANTAVGDFIPHVVTVYTGEDVAGKIMSLVQKGPRGICILSANGAISNVTIRQPGSSGGILTYEARIVVGSFMQNGYKAQKRKYQHREQALASPTSPVPDIVVTAARPISQAHADGENFLMHMSQIPDQNQRESVSVTSDKQNLDATPDATATWNGSEDYDDQRTSPDINITLPDE